MKSSILVITNLFVEALKRELEKISAYSIDIVDGFEVCNKEKYECVVLWWNLHIERPDIYNLFLSGNIDKEVASAILLEKIERVAELFSGNSNLIIITQDIFCGNEYLVMKDSLSELSLLSFVNENVTKMMSNNATIIDINKIMVRVGMNNVYDIKNGLRWNKIYTDCFCREIANSLVSEVLAFSFKSKKCIILDCDNVLWGGIVSEVGISGIELGAYSKGKGYQEFQRLILSLYYLGIIICVCSKNDPKDVYDVFDNHSGMVLKKEHISAFAVSWQSKTESIISISNAIGIDVSDMVFVDDSDYELMDVKNKLPDIEIIKFDVYQYFKVTEYFRFNKRQDIEVNMQRQKSYKMKEVISKSMSSVDNSLAKSSIPVEIKIKNADISEAMRISELSMRVNRCTNGVRLEYSDVLNVIKDDKYQMYTIYVGDCYANYGLTGIAITMNNEILLLAFSCRILERGVEEYVLNVLKESNGIDEIKFIRSLRNEKFEAFLKSVGLKVNYMIEAGQFN